MSPKMDARERPPPTPSMRDLKRQRTCVMGWGRNDSHQIGGNSAEDDTVTDAVPLEPLRNIGVTCADGHLYHSAFVTADGELFMCGSNDASQLALKNVEVVPEPRRSAALDVRVMDAVACGSSFTVAVSRQGEMLGWGAGEFGQVGSPVVIQQAVPRLIRGLPACAKIRRVVAGTAHVLALSEQYQVYSFGMGLHGALGHNSDESTDTPTLVQGLWCAGIVAVAAGDDHSMALAADGRVWTWGRGKYGALGHDTLDSRFVPEQVKALHTSPVVSIAAGGNHSVALSAKRRVYCWGSNQWGQLGVGNTIDASMPIVLEGSHSWRITHVTAGSRHTLLQSATGTVYGCGCTEFGQLGKATEPMLTVPRAIPVDDVELGMRPALATACGDHNLVIMCPEAASPQCQLALQAVNSPIKIPDLLALASSCRPCSGAAAAMQDSHAQEAARQELIQAIHNVFSSPGLLLAGFCLPQRTGDVGPGDWGGESRHRLDIAAVKDVFECMLLVLDSDVVLALQSAIFIMLQNIYQREEVAASHGCTSALSQAQWLKVLVILFLNPANSDAHKSARDMIEALARVLFSLKSKARQLLISWLSQLPPDILGGRCIRPLQRHLTAYIEMYGWGKGRNHVLLVGSVLRVLDDANKLGGELVPYTQLQNSSVSAAVLESLQAEWLAWQKVKQGLSQWGAAEALPQSLCQLPFLMTAECKKMILQGEGSALMHAEVQNSFQRAIHMMRQGAVLIGPHQMAEIGHVPIQVRRDHVLGDSMQQLQMHISELRKPLRITFLGGEHGAIKEEAVDEGGVTKEWFQLLIRELFQPAFGMFEYMEETREFWFSPAASHIGVSKEDFRMVGIVLGLAIFNGVILDVHFPLVVYKKLLNGVPMFVDLMDAQPSLAKGLQALLQYDGDDVEDVFCRTFEAEFDVLDTKMTVELTEGGSEMPVTKRNRQEFVNLFVDWYLNKSIADVFEEFKAGFYSVASGSSLVLFNANELELLVCGLPHLDFAELERATVYEGYTAQDPTIKNCWKIVHSFSLEEKKRFLSFVTGCNRAPMGGLGKLRMVIQRSGRDTDSLPTAHTCFNVLLLPEYTSEEKLRQKLILAIGNAEGFGLQ